MKAVSKIGLMKQPSGKKSASKGRQRAVDTGMALTLLCMIVGLIQARTGWFAAASVLLVITMTSPAVFGPAAKLWFGLSGLLGAVMSRVLLSVVYFAVLTPVGLLRRVLGKDSLNLSAFKMGSGSVFVTRGAPFTAADLKAPF